MAYFFIAEALQQELDCLLFASCKAELLGYPTQDEAQRPSTFQHKESYRFFHAFAVAIQKKSSASISPSSRLQRQNVMSIV